MVIENKQNLKKKTTQMKAMASELNMYQAQVDEYGTFTVVASLLHFAIIFLGPTTGLI